MKKAILYLHVSPETKKWLKRTSAKQVGSVSQSTFAEQIFVAAKKLGTFEPTKKTTAHAKRTRTTTASN